MNSDYYRLISISGLSINYVWVYVTQGNFTTKLKPLYELKITKVSQKWIPKAIELTSIPTHKKCKCKPFCSQRYKQGLVVKFYSSDVIVRKGYSERKEREERTKKKEISSLERTYHIYSNKRSTSNKRPPRISAHLKGRNWKNNRRPASNKCRISVRLVLQVYYYVAIVFITFGIYAIFYTMVMPLRITWEITF